jgi:hypothetical protein
MLEHGRELGSRGRGVAAPLLFAEFLLLLMVLCASTDLTSLFRVMSREIKLGVEQFRPAVLC